MMTFGSRFKERREAKGLTQRQLAERIKVTAANISQWENDVGNPARINRRKLERAARTLSTRMEYLEHGTGDPQASELVEMDGIREMSDDSDYDSALGALLHVYDMDVSAGPGISMPEYIETGMKLHFSRAWLRSNDANEDDLKIVRVRGNSMEPLLYEGDRVVINLSKTRVRNDRVFALVYGGDARVKRIQQLAGGNIRVMSDNPDKARFPDEIIAGEGLNELQVIGQVIHKMGNGGL